jgi:hypothetical protein
MGNFYHFFFNGDQETLNAFAILSLGLMHDYCNATLLIPTFLVREPLKIMNIENIHLSHFKNASYGFAEL